MTGDLRYPIGRHDVLAPVSARALERAMRSIRELPEHLGKAVDGLGEEQLATPYRPGGWTVAQLVHHVADSHVNATTRLRLALSEESPRIRPYDEKGWAELPDARSLDLAPSLRLLEGLHRRWSSLLDALGAEGFARPLVHPDLGELSVAQLTGLYGWHSRHHVAHVAAARKRLGWP